MDFQDRRYNIVNINDFNELRSIILNEIESHEAPNQSRSNKSRLIEGNKPIHNYEELNKFIISMYTTFSKNIRDYKILTFFLSQITGIQDIIKYSDHKHSIIYDIATQLDYEYIEANKLIFKIGDKSDKFYIIIKGNLSIITCEEENVYINEEQFLAYLIKLRRNGENDLLDKCLKLNRNKIGEIELKKWLKFRDYNPKKLDLKNTYSEEFIVYLEESLYVIESTDNLSVREYIERISIDYDKYTSKNEKKNYTVLKYIVRRELKDNEIFGELSFLNAKRKRTATVISNYDCHFLVLKKTNFNNILLTIYEKIKKDNLLYFMKKDIFKGFDKTKFSEKFYDYFLSTQINHDKFLVSENEEPKRIYFIKYGEFEISFKKSLKQIYNIINFYKGKDKEKKLNIGFEYDDDKFEEYSKSTKLIKISITKRDEIIGLDDMIMNGQYIYSVRCISPIGEVFQIERKDFENIIENSGLVKCNISNFIWSKKQYLKERLIEIKRNLIRIFKMSEERIYKRNNFSKKEIINVKNSPIESNVLQNHKSKEKITNSDFVKSSSDRNPRVKSSHGLIPQIKDLKKVIIPHIQIKSKDQNIQGKIDKDSNFSSLQTINNELTHSASYKILRLNDGQIPLISKIISPNSINLKETLNTVRDEKTRNISTCLINTMSENKLVINQIERTFRSKFLKNYQNINLKTTFNTVNEKKEIESAQAENLSLYRTKYSSNNEAKKYLQSVSSALSNEKDKSKPLLFNFSKKLEIGNSLFKLHTPLNSNR